MQFTDVGGKSMAQGGKMGRNLGVGGYTGRGLHMCRSRVATICIIRRIYAERQKYNTINVVKDIYIK